MNQKNLFGRFTATILIIMMLSPVFSLAVSAEGETSADVFPGATFTDPPEWYQTVNGVLSSDTYTLYPYATKSMDIGFSKYGEMISYNKNTQLGVGIQYPGYESVSTYDQRAETSADPFANEKIMLVNWINGWLIDLKYMDTDGFDKEYWAMALFSDGDLPGKDWITMPEVKYDDVARPLWQQYQPFANPDVDAYYTNPGAAYKGGRKTNGICETEPIVTLYDGPRKYIGWTVTHVMDKKGTPLVDVHITFIFDKVEKHVILLKDVKILWDKSPINIQFGNRGEWDLNLKGYVHFYTDEPVQEWDLNGNGVISTEEKAKSFEYYRQWMVENKYPKKWWDDVDSYQIPIGYDTSGW